MASGEELRECLLQAGILRRCTQDEARMAAQCIETERVTAVASKVQRQALEKFCAALHLSAGEGGCAANLEQHVFSLERYNHFFARTVYVLRERPDGANDGWPFLRCTCLPASIHSKCEHLLVARSLGIPGMIDTSVSSDVIPSQKKRGRPVGSFSTVRGKKVAEGRRTSK